MGQNQLEDRYIPQESFMIECAGSTSIYNTLVNKAKNILTEPPTLAAWLPYMR
jgi:hypothetical protein